MDAWTTDPNQINDTLEGERWRFTLWKYSAGHSSAEFVLFGVSSNVQLVGLLTGVVSLNLETTPRETQLRLARREAGLELQGESISIRAERIQLRKGTPSPNLTPDEMRSLIG